MARNDHSGYPLKWFKDQNATRNAYECAICLEVLKDPVQVRDCGHQFCALCIDDILKTDPRCPTCRIEISDVMIFEDHAAMRLIKQLVVNCCNEGCSWQGCLSSLLQGHQNNCNFSIRRGDDLDKKVEQLVQTLETQLMLKISTLEIKHQQDIKELKLKHEQDIKELKLKVISTYEEDIKELELKVISTYEEDIKELKLKLQQSENRLQLLEEKEKELCEKEKQAAAKEGYERLEIPRIYHPFIQGPNQETIQKIAMETNTKIYIPPLSVQKDEITISGDKEGVAVAKDKILRIYKEKERRVTAVSFEVKKSEHKYVAGPKGHALQEIFASTGVSVEMPPLDSDTEVITLRGEPDRLATALIQVYDRANRRSNTEGISLAPSFGQWGHSIEAGLNNSSQKQDQPEGNRYSTLSGADMPPSQTYDPRRSSSACAREATIKNGANEIMDKATEVSDRVPQTLGNTAELSIIFDSGPVEQIKSDNQDKSLDNSRSHVDTKFLDGNDAHTDVNSEKTETKVNEAIADTKKIFEPPKKKSSKQRFKDLNKKETGGHLMDAYTDKPPPQEPVVTVVEEKVMPVEITSEESEKPLEEDLSWEDKGEKIGDEVKVHEKKNDAEAAAPVEQTRRKYERDFLLQFQFLKVCTEKPVGLPDIEVVLDAPASPSKGSGSQRGGSDFLPLCARQKSQLKQSENRWQPPEETEKELSDTEKKTAQLYRNVMAILNKLTPQKFKTLVEQTMALNIDTPEHLEGVIDRIFEKAIGEPMFSVAYANMCRCLFYIKVADAEGKDVSFRKLLLNRCQKEFEKEKDEQEFAGKLKQFEGLPEEGKKAKKEEMDEAIGKNKRRMLGNIKFIGELFKLKLLTENIMHDCIFKLLRAGDEESLESLCKLLFTIGKDLDSEKAKPRIEQFFDNINRIIVAKKVSLRVIFKLRDVVELRQNKWVPRREENYNPKTIDQIHKEAQLEKMQEQRLAEQLPAKDNKHKKGGPGERDSLKPTSNDGWITNLPINQNKLRNMAKRANDEEIPLGPSARFGQWGRGSSAGLNNSSQGQDEPQANRFSALSAGSGGGDMPSNRPYDPRRSNSAGSRPSSGGSRGSDKSRVKSDKDRESALEAVTALSKPQNEKPQVTQNSNLGQAVIMQGQRQGPCIAGHPMAMGPRSMQPRAMYSSSSQGHSPMQGYIQQQNMQYQVVGQDPYGQPVMRPAFIPNVQPAYQMQPTTAPFQPQYHPQQHQYYNQGMSPMYYAVQPNQQIQAQQLPQLSNPTIQTNNLTKPKPKRTGKIVIRDPKDNKDVAEQILSHTNAANGRAGSTPPLTNSTAQTESSYIIQAQFSAQVAARVGLGKRTCRDKVKGQARLT